MTLVLIPYFISRNEILIESLPFDFGRLNY